MHKLLHTMAALAGLALLNTPAQADDTHAVVARTAAAAAATPSPASATLGPAGEGRRLYLKLNCYSCHGMAAGGGMGPRIVRAGYGDVSEALLQGESEGMRSYKAYVTATDISNIAAYLGSIGTVSEPKFRDWWVAVPTK